MRKLALGATLLLLACNSPQPVSEAAPSKSNPPVAPVAPVAQAPAVPMAAPASSSAAQALTRVTDTSQVCMVNNQYMGRDQIPVEVEGKTYFGCCEMCKGRLTNDPSSRSATDPVNGKLVDKATAVIAKRASGDVLYFENTETFERYRAM
jgi:YHS domain-containing protein